MFCPNCGSQVNGSFCANCGRSLGPTAPSAQAPAPAAAPPVSSGGSGTKIILIIVGVMVALGLLGVTAVMLVAHKVKQVAHDYGVDVSPSATARVGPAHSYDACELLSKDEAAQILNTPIASSKLNGRGVRSICDYYPVKGGSEDDIASAVDKLKQIGNQPDSPQKTGQVQDAFTKMARSAVTDPSQPILTVTIDGRDGRSDMAGFAGAFRIMGGITKGTGFKASEEIQGIGDRAVLSGIGGMMVLKGDTSVSLGGPAILGSRDGSIALARRIVSRL